MDLHDPRRRDHGRSIDSSINGARTQLPVCNKRSAERRARDIEARGRLDALAGDHPLLRVDDLVAGYGETEILHGIDLRLGAGQSMCIVGPEGAGKSTILHSIFGLTEIRGGRVEVGGRNVTRLGPNAKLRDAGVAYVLRDSSVFPDVTVERNLWLGQHLMGQRADARHAAERVFARYPSLASRRDEPAGTLSCGECRLLEISRALVMQPRLLLVDRPTLGLDTACAEKIFDALQDLHDREHMSIVIVEQNARRGLMLADIGCVVVDGVMAMVGTGSELLENPAVGRLFSGV